MRSAALQPLCQASWHSVRDAAPPVGEGAARAPVVPPRSPHAPPSNCEGDLWGDLQAVGRETGSLLRLLRDTTHPQPLPVREGAMPTPRPPVGGSKGVRARGSVFREHPDRGPAGCSRLEIVMANV